MNPTNQHIQRVKVQTPNVPYHDKQNKEVRWQPMYTSSNFPGGVSSGNLFWKANYSMATIIRPMGWNNRNFPSIKHWYLCKWVDKVSI